MAHLTLGQRYKIESYTEAGYQDYKIAKKLGVSRSTISREKSRNKDKRNGVYKAALAQKKSRSRQKQKKKKKYLTEEIKARIKYYLEEDYSPEQIKGYCDEHKLACVSHERIYQYIWEDKANGGKLYKHLRNKGRRYRKRGNQKDTRGLIPNRVGIENRPEEVEQRKRFGDLEVDLIIGKNHKQAIVTINDRASGMLKMGKVTSKQADEVSDKINELLEDWIPFIHTMTSDNGKEFAQHQKVAETLQIDYYFAKPYHSWQRGSNENLNGLIRQYFPKNCNFENISDEQIKQVQYKLNTRPRKRYKYQNPIFVMNHLLFNKEVAFIT